MMTKKLQGFLSSDSRLWLMGFAILMIVSLHFCMYGNLMRYDILRFFFSKGYLGVDIFFLLSSYGLCYSYNNNSLKKYYANRLNRLFPIYAVFLLLLLAFFKVVLPYPKLVVALFQISGISLFTGVEIEWFIPALILLYVLFPLLYEGVTWLYKNCFVSVLALLFILVLASPYASRYISMFVVERLPIVVTGILFYLVCQDNDSRSLCVVVLFGGVLSILFSAMGLVNERLTSILCVPAAVLLLSQAEIALPFPKLMQFLGKHTLEIYLAQNLALNQFYANNDMSFILKTVVASGIIVVGSVVLWGVQEGWNRIRILGN